MRPTLPVGLVRHPLEPDPSLRAWDSADALLLDWLAGRAETGPTFPVGPAGASLAETVVVGDRFGALALGLVLASPEGHLRVFGDNVLADEAIARNARRVGVASTRWSFAETTELDALPAHSVTRVVYKVPRDLGTLEHTLHSLRRVMPPGAELVGGGMTRQVHTSTLKQLESIVGPTLTSHARRRARLIHTRVDPALEPPADPWPIWWEFEGIRTCNHAGVFSASGLDQGTRVLLEHLPRLIERLPPDARSVVDLGCGNGILGTWLARARPGVDLEFRDVSFTALRSAEATFRATLPDERARFTAADGMHGRDAASVDLVVCNPPFHAQGARGDRTSGVMFAGAHRALRPGGQLWVVGNRHLGYLKRLRRRFGEADLVADHPRFQVIRAARRSG